MEPNEDTSDANEHKNTSQGANAENMADAQNQGFSNEKVSSKDDAGKSVKTEPVEEGSEAGLERSEDVAGTQAADEERANGKSEKADAANEALDTTEDKVRIKSKTTTKTQTEQEQQREIEDFMAVASDEDSLFGDKIVVDNEQVEETSQGNSPVRDIAGHDMHLDTPSNMDGSKDKHPKVNRTPLLADSPGARSTSDLDEQVAEKEQEQQTKTKPENAEDQDTEMHDYSGRSEHHANDDEDDTEKLDDDSVDHDQGLPQDEDDDDGDNDDGSLKLDDIRDFIESIQSKQQQHEHVNARVPEDQHHTTFQSDSTEKPHGKHENPNKYGYKTSLAQSHAQQHPSITGRPMNPAGAPRPTNMFMDPFEELPSMASLDRVPQSGYSRPETTEEDPMLRSGSPAILPNFSLQSLQQYTSHQFEGQGVSAAGYGHFLTETHRPFIPPPMHHGPYSWPKQPSALGLLHAQRKSHRPAAIEIADTTDDDEPLLTRAPRHAFVSSDPFVDSSPARAATQSGKNQVQDSGSDSDFIDANPKTNSKPTQTPPLQSTETLDVAKKSSSPDNMVIDWKLPEYEAQFEPGATRDDPDIAKVSIPGVIREELILSPDHSDQEIHLLLNVFIPGQKSLAIPDPCPAQAILNFHTVAVMVIEAFVQFEIGDEFGTGRGHWHDNHDRDDAEYQRLRDAKDAETDEIFFAVIDRWRAGLESNKQPSKLLRGAQEFCDIALEIIYYIKEHGLFRKEKGKEKPAKHAPALKRGAKKVETGTKAKTKPKTKPKDDDDGSDFELTPSRGGKRAKTGANVLHARKKPKIESPRGKAGGRKKGSEGQVTVTRTPRKKKA